MTAEISNALKQYDEAGLLDYISIEQWIRNAMKEFGNNILSGYEKVIPIISSKGTLPGNHHSLMEAVKCDMEGYHCEGKKAKRHLQASIFYNQRTEVTVYDQKPPERSCTKLIREDIYFEDKTEKATLYYNNFQPLKLVGHYKKDTLDKRCPNRRQNSSHEFSINGTQVHTNFSEGSIFIRYKGFEEEDGELIIPDIQRNKLQEYIKYTCIRRTLESLLLTGDDPNIAQKLQYFRQMENENYLAAKNDAFAEGSKGWQERIKGNNRYFNSIRYENMIPII